MFRPKPIQPCLPRPAKEPPAGSGWIHEIKHDGFRIMARRDETGVRLYTRNGYNFADRFPRKHALANLLVRVLRSWRHDHAAVLCAFDVIELDGKDMRWVPIEKPHRRSRCQTAGAVLLYRWRL
jgi:ATP-dependent DNA ligase